MIPVTLGIIVGLFVIQRRGTEQRRPAVRPGHAGLVRRRSRCSACWRSSRSARRAARASTRPARCSCSLAQPGLALAILGAVFLAVTGGEALYADMGHFGRTAGARSPGSPSSGPALLLNYFGQGALLLARPARDRQPVLRARARAVPAGAAGRARDGGDDHRVAGHDLRRVLRHAPGRAARPAAARRDPADLGDRARPDLRARREHGFMFVCVVAVRARLRLFDGAVGGLRRVGGRHDVHHDAARRRSSRAPRGSGRCGASRWSSACCSSSTSRSSPATSPRSPTAAGCR